MARKKSKRQTEVETGQLALPFEIPPAPVPPKGRDLAPTTTTKVAEPIVVEVVEQPIERADARSQWTLGQREHELLVHHADKYEGRVYKAMTAFVVAVIADVTVHGGLPVLQALLKRYDLPLLPNTMLSGVCGLAAITFFCAMVYFYARLRVYSVQLWLNLDASPQLTRNWAHRLALTLGAAWVGALAAMLALVIYLSASDAVFVIRSLVWNIAPTPWQTQTSPSKLP